jgi:hypothetical protein
LGHRLLGDVEENRSKGTGDVYFLKFSLCYLFFGSILCVTPGAFAATASGHVIDPSGKPVVGATVYLFDFAKGSNKTTTTITDATGSFTAEVAPDTNNPAPTRPDRCMIDAPGFAASGGTISAGSDNQFQLSLPETITGKVVDVDGKPVVGATVEAQYAADSMPAGDVYPNRYSHYMFAPLKSRFTTKTDLTGSYKISDLPTNDVVIVALDDPAYLQTSTEVPQGSTLAPNMVGKAGAEIVGKVVREDGKPVEQVQVSAQNPTLHLYGAALVNPDGSYKIGSLQPAIYSIAVNADFARQSFAPPEPENVSASVGVVATAPDLVLDTDTTVKGTILDSATKAPVAGVRVDFEDADVRANAGRSINIVTGPDGAFLAHVWPGTLAFYVYDVPEDYVSGGLADHTQTIKVARDQGTTMDPVLLDRGLSVKLLVTDETGKPVSNLSLLGMTSDGQSIYGSGQPTTADDGSVTLSQLAPGSYTVDPGSLWVVESPKTFDVPATTPITLVLKKAELADIQGKVVDTSGAPVPGVTLTFDKEYIRSNNYGSREQVTATTGVDGSYTIPNAPVNPDMVEKESVLKEGYIYRSGGVFSKVANQVTVDPIVMAQLGGSVSGIVLNGQHQPVAGAWVACPSGDAQDKMAQTDALGHFVLSNLIEGATTLYAEKGKYFAESPVRVNSTTTDVSVTLAPMSTAPLPSDLNGATSVMTKLLIEDKSWRNVWLSDKEARDCCSAALAPESSSAALSFVGSYGEIDSEDLWLMISATDVQNPLATSRWALPILSRATDKGPVGEGAADLGVHVAPYDPKIAKQLYAIAVRAIPLSHIDENSLDEVEDLVALQYALHLPEADDSYAKLTAAVADIVAKDKATSNAGDPGWIYSNLASKMALGNLNLGVKLLSNVPSDYIQQCATRAVTSLVLSEPQAALKFFSALRVDGDANSVSAYESVVPIVLPDMYRTDPGATTALAYSLVDPSMLSAALVTLADLMPMSEATSIYKNAEAQSIDQDGQGCTPASVAAHAYLRDPVLGKALYAQALDKVTDEASTTSGWGGPSMAEFAFYYSRLDPGYSKLLLEEQFAEDVVSPSQSPDPSQAICEDVAAMSAIDPARAYEMAAAIPNGQTRFQACLKIGQYQALSQAQRNTLPFSLWAQAWGDWSVGTPAAW